MSKQPIFPRSTVLVLGPNSVQSLVPSTLISQAESLLESHRLDDAYNLADQRRKKLEESITIDEDEVSALQFPSHRVKIKYAQGRRTALRIPTYWISMFYGNTIRRRGEAPVQRRSRSPTAHKLLP